MTTSEALIKISSAYVPGVVAFYGRMNPDPWQQAHDSFERTIIGNRDDGARSAAAEQFSSRCLQLIDTYKSARLPFPKKLTVGDAFAIGDPTRFKAIQSIKNRACYACEDTKGLSIEPVSAGSVEVRLVCAECAKERA